MNIYYRYRGIPFNKGYFTVILPEILLKHIRNFYSIDGVHCAEFVAKIFEITNKYKFGIPLYKVFPKDFIRLTTDFITRAYMTK